MRITEIVYEKKETDLLFSLAFLTTEQDSDYTIYTLNNEVKEYKEIFCSKTPGKNLKKRFFLNNSFWSLNEDCLFLFQGNFEDCTIVQTLIAQIIKRVTEEGFSKDYSEGTAYGLFRDIRALELYWN